MLPPKKLFIKDPQKLKRRLAIILPSFLLVSFYIIFVLILYSITLHNEIYNNLYDAYAFTIGNSALNEYSSLEDDGLTYIYSRNNEQSSSIEEVTFKTSNGAILGIPNNSDSYVFGGEEYVSVSFRITNNNNKKISKVSYETIKIDSRSTTSEPKEISKGEYVTSKDKETDTFTLTYTSNEPIYVYRFSLVYLIKR